MPKAKSKFKSGDVIVWEPKNFDPQYWKGLSEKDRKKYYGKLGYGLPEHKRKLFVFICTINVAHADTGHCVLLDMDDGHLEYMRHTTEFRRATDDEF